MTPPLRLVIDDGQGAGRLTAELVARLLTELQNAPSPARVMTLESNSEVFCTGLDLTLLSEQDETVSTTLTGFAALLREIESAPRPVIALVDGAALGGGLGLACAADIVIATTRATFGLPETLFGLVPALVFPAIARRIGVARARWLALSAATISANDAWRIGLVDDLTDDLETTLSRYLARCERLDANALAEVKSIASAFEVDSIGYQATAGARFQRVWNSPEARKRIARFNAGHPPWPEPDEA